MGKPNVVSLFAGAGGMDLGFKQAGFDIVWANDFDVDSVRTYQRNLGRQIIQMLSLVDFHVRVFLSIIKRDLWRMRETISTKRC